MRLSGKWGGSHFVISLSFIGMIWWIDDVLLIIEMKWWWWSRKRRRVLFLFSHLLLPVKKWITEWVQKSWFKIYTRHLVMISRNKRPVNNECVLNNVSKTSKLYQKSSLRVCEKRDISNQNNVCFSFSYLSKKLKFFSHRELNLERILVAMMIVMMICSSLSSSLEEKICYLF
jgi:hypothetical protein